jgi:hypothetical protein
MTSVIWTPPALGTFMCLHAFSRRKTAKLREAQSARFGKASESCALILIALQRAGI